MNVLEAFLKEADEKLEADGLKRKLRTLQGAQGPRIIVNGKEVLNFSSNNYLGLADDLRLVDAAKASMEKEGFGAGASRLVCGSMQAHKDLEQAIAEFKSAESCLVFSTGYMANVGIISSVFNRDDIIFSDRLNHASIIDGIHLSKADFKRFKHNDMDDLESLLKQTNNYRKKAIIVDSVFSMDGDIAPLDRIVALAKKYNCMVMIDEAHGMGVFGRNGRGVAEHFGVEKDIDIHMGTLSKAAGSFGAYCCGSSELIDFLINKSRSFIYTTAMPPSLAAASRKSIEIIQQVPQLRKTLWDNVNFMLDELKKIKLDTLQAASPIIPIVVKDPLLAVEFSKRLFDQGILISAIRPPTVPARTARLRLTVTASHTKQELVFTLEQLKKIGKELCLI